MNQRIRLFWAIRSTLEVDQRVQKHSHSCYQLYYILSGFPVFVIGEQTLRACPNSFLLIPAATPHHICPLEKERICFYELKLYLNDPFLINHLQNCSLILQDTGLIKDYLTYVVQNYSCKDTQNSENIECILTALLLRFFIHDLNYDNMDSCLINTEQYDPLIRSIIVYIEKNYKKKFSLHNMAKTLNYNKNYLSVIFKKKTGVTVIDYLNFIRIRQAIIFLIFYNQDVYTTRESSGFSNSSYFCRAFKSMVGVAPDHFRRAFATTTHDCVSSFFSDNPTLNYQPCTMEEGFQSLRAIGQTAISLLEMQKKKSK